MLDKSLEAKLVERQGKGNFLSRIHSVMLFPEVVFVSLNLSPSSPVEQLDDLRKQLEKERDLKCEEATKEFNNMKSEVESRRRDLEARQRNVEAVVVEVLCISF